MFFVFRSSNQSFPPLFSLYGFHRLQTGPLKGSYAHEKFRRDEPDLISQMERQKPQRKNRTSPPSASTFTPSGTLKPTYENDLSTSDTALSFESSSAATSAPLRKILVPQHIRNASLNTCAELALLGPFFDQDDSEAQSECHPTTKGISISYHKQLQEQVMQHPIYQVLAGVPNRSNDVTYCGEDSSRSKDGGNISKPALSDFPADATFQNTTIFHASSHSSISGQYSPGKENSSLKSTTKKNKFGTKQPTADGNHPQPFPRKLYQLLLDAEEWGFDNIISWTSDGLAIQIHQKEAFVADVLPQYFDQSHYASFRRQLNLYGFVLCSRSGIYRHPHFCRGEEASCQLVTRAAASSSSKDKNGHNTTTSSSRPRPSTARNNLRRHSSPSENFLENN